MLMIGYDVYLSSPNAHATAKALGNLDSLVVCDLFMTASAQCFGTVFLPVQSSFEKDGTFMNAERRIQRIRRAVRPRGSSKSDWEILCLLASKMGAGRHFAYQDAEAIWNEVRAVWPVAAGISWPRIENAGLQWPCPTDDHPGTEVLHSSSFPVGVRAAFQRLEFHPSGEQSSAEFPFILNTGRTLFHFNAATMTGRTRNAELERDDLVQIHPGDASRLGIRDGDQVSIESRHGQFRGTATVTDTVRKGELFSVFHNVAALVNNATGTGRDSNTHTPEYKVTAVRIARAPAQRT
jgi:formate dehydrogenase major subunit